MTDDDSPQDRRHAVTDIRRELVGRLTEAGMSTRAIAPAVGAGVMTVSDDRKALRAAGVRTPYTSAPDPLAEEKADGRVVKPTGPGSLLAIGRRLEELERPGRPRDAT